MANHVQNWCLCADKNSEICGVSFENQFTSDIDVILTEIKINFFIKMYENDP